MNFTGSFCQRIGFVVDKQPLAPNRQLIPHFRSQFLSACRAKAQLLSPRRCSTTTVRVAAEAAQVAQPEATYIGFDQTFHEQYELHERVGRGAESEVFLGTERDGGERLAVKRIKKVFTPEGGLSPAFAARLRHQIELYDVVGRGLSIAALYGAYEDDEYVYCVQELCTGGELWQHIGDHYSEAYAARIMRYVLQTIAQFHAHGVVWRDVKPENFLFLNKDDDSPLKAVDFGTAERCEPGEYITVRAGSPLFVAPEVLRQRYNHSADLWGAGMLCYMLLTARLPFATDDASVTVADLYSGARNVSRRQAFEALLGFHLDFESPHFTSLSDGAQEFVQSLLQEDADARPTAAEALSHHWIQDDAPDKPFESTLIQRFQRFSSYNRFKQVVLQALATEVRSSADIIVPPELHAEFALLDPEGTGMVPIGALEDRLLNPPFSISRPEAQRLLSQVDIDDDHMVAYDQWLASMLTWRTVEKCKEWDEWIESAFSAIDQDSSGSLSPEDVTAFLCKDGKCLSEDQLRAALEDAHRASGEGMTLEDFRSLIAAPGSEHPHDEADLHIFESRLQGSAGSLDSSRDSAAE